MADRFDLHGEFLAATQALTLRHREALATRYGVDADAIRRSGGGIGIARVSCRDDGFYEPTEQGQGELALIWPIWTGEISPNGYCEGELIDLLAWHPKRAEAFHRRTGDGVALGLAAIERSLAGQGLGDVPPLHLYRTPFDWARAGAGCLDRASSGAVMLDWSIDNGLFSVRTVVAQDLAHGEELEHRLKLLRWKLVPVLPDISVPATDDSRPLGKVG